MHIFSYVILVPSHMFLNFRFFYTLSIIFVWSTSDTFCVQFSNVKYNGSWLDKIFVYIRKGFLQSYIIWKCVCPNSYFVSISWLKKIIVPSILFNLSVARTLQKLFSVSSLSLMIILHNFVFKLWHYQKLNFNKNVYTNISYFCQFSYCKFA